MARRYKKKGRSARAKPSIVSMAPIAYLGYAAYEGFKADGLNGAMLHVIPTVVPINVQNRTIDTQRFIPFVGVCAGAWAAKKVIAMTGANRALKGMPFRL